MTDQSAPVSRPTTIESHAKAVQNNVTVLKLGVVCLFTVVTGCGGGGGETAFTPASISPIVPLPLPANVLTKGSPHTDVNADYGQAAVTFSAGARTFDASLIGTYPSVTGDFPYLDVSHIFPGLASAVWAAGWNGYGQSISVIDDFRSGGISYSQSFPIDRLLTTTREEYDAATNRVSFSTYLATYRVEYTSLFTTTHGAIVSNIAGGDEIGTPVQSTVDVTPKLPSLSTCIQNGAVAPIERCASVVGANISSLWNVTTVPVTYRKAPGIAKAASVIEHHVDLSAGQDPFLTTSYLVGEIDNSFQTSVINLSLGTDVRTSGISLTKVMDDINNNNRLTKMSEAVITIAAGNSFGPCGFTDLAGCNYLAAYYALAPQTRDNVLVIGATTGVGRSEKLALYSTRAGVLADRFILASGDTSEADVVGTSFAAPRVAGAVAIVRQKYPNLSATQVASLLLLTANKDIDNDGVDDFVGVSPIYGHGKLDLVKALSPVGTAAITQ